MRQSCNGSVFFVVVRTLLLRWGEGTERNEMMNVMKDGVETGVVIRLSYDEGMKR